VQISLQHALYLLHHGMLDDANRNLSKAETWRYGEKSSSQEVLINLVQAYKGLLQYYTWTRKKMELSKLGESEAQLSEDEGTAGQCGPQTTELIHALGRLSLP
jgi:TATA box-binding protein-associated factor RNA polymerase I subunit A